MRTSKEDALGKANFSPGLHSLSQSWNRHHAYLLEHYGALVYQEGAKSATRSIKSLRLGLLAILFLLGLCMSSPVLANDEGITNVTVEILIFSGRPNPTFQLKDPAPLKALQTRIKNLPEAFSDEPADWTRLGFAGFRIHGAENLGLPERIRVYKGVIQTGHGKTVRHLNDSVGLEKILIREAEQQPLEQPIKDAITNYGKSRDAAPGGK